VRGPFRSGWRLEWTFTASTALLVVGLIGTTMLVVHTRVARTLRHGLELRALSMARSIGAVATPSLLAYNYAALQIAAEGAAGDADVEWVAIHDKEGAVAGLAAHAGATPLGHGMPGAAPGDPPTGGSRSLGGDEGARPDTVLEVAVPVHVEGVAESWGKVRVGLSTESMEAELHHIDLGLAALGTALALLAVGSARWVARHITAPLRRLADGTEALSAGDLSHRIPVGGAKELADLAGAFNRMTDRVQEKACESALFQSRLEALNETLEEQVRERTRALAESEAQYKTLVDHSPDAIVIVQQGRVRFVNPAFEEIFGLTREEVLDGRFDPGSIFHDSSKPLVADRMRSLENGESPAPLGVQGIDAAGRIRRLELRGSRIEYLGRAAAECLLVDTTEADALRERLSETEKLRSLGELAGGVAHDFNNLLGAILARVQLMRRRDLDEPLDRELAVIERAALDGRETVRRIQEFSRVRRDRRFAPVDLAGILRDSVEITRTRWKNDAESRNVSIQLSASVEEVSPILGNAAELREVFTNLILNAVDALPQGGRLHVGCSADGGRIRAEVSDNGVGMTENIRQHLFDPFFSTKGSKGMGLGLSMVYGIVTRHGGSIDVRSALGAGSAFLLEFPAAEGLRPEPAGEAPARHPAAAASPARVLVIDDEPAIAEVLADILTLGGHSVDVALSPREGVRLARAGGYDVVFTDLGMPDMTGWEVAESIHQVHPSLPVALVTGWAATIDEADIRRRGIAILVHKPFELAEIERVLAELLAAAAASPAVPA